MAARKNGDEKVQTAFKQSSLRRWW